MSDAVLDALLEDTHDYFRSQLALERHLLDLIVLWLAAAKTMPAWDRLGFLRLQSPLPGSGKTVALENLARLIGAAAVHTGNLTEAAAFRLAATEDRVFLLDEVDVLMPAARTSDRIEALRGLIAQSWKRGSTVQRARAVSKKVGDIEVEEFRVFALVALAGLATLPPTIADRSIPILMRRASEAERRELRVLRDRDGDAEAAPLRERWEKWATDAVIADLAARRPELPADLTGRQQDNVEALVAIAERAGQPWPLRVHDAIVKVYGGAYLTGRATYGALLLEGAHEVFRRHPVADFIPTPTFLLELRSLDSGPFASRYKGDPLSSRDIAPMSQRLAADLREFGIFPKPKRIGGEVRRGYYLEDFADAFTRYVPEAVGAVAAVAASGEDIPEALPFPENTSKTSTEDEVLLSWGVS